MFAHNAREQASYIERITALDNTELQLEMNHMFETAHNAVIHDDEQTIMRLNPFYRILMLEARSRHLVH